MPDHIGVRPSRTSVQLSTETGGGSIPAATPRSAGAMTARQAEILERLDTWSQTLQEGDVMVLGHALPMQARLPAPPVLAQPVTPALPPEIATVPQQLSELHERVAALEQAKASGHGVDKNTLYELAKTLETTCERVRGLGDNALAQDIRLNGLSKTIEPILESIQRLNGTDLLTEG